MTYDRFEDLPVWQTAVELALGVDDFVQDTVKLLTYAKRDQLDRASLSISKNIAEGFERGSTAELLRFLYISRGSAGEVRSMLCVFGRLERLGEFTSQISDLKSLAESCSRQLRSWADSLQDTEIKGQRYLNSDTRAAYKKRQPDPTG